MENTKKNGGFTLLEMVISMGLFVSIMALVVGVFAQGLRLEGHVTSLTEINSNISLVIEQISREIRGGFDFATSSEAGTLCAAGLGDKISFKRIRGSTPVDVAVWWNKANGTVERQEGSGDPTVMTASSISVKKLCFLMNQDGAAQRELPWRVTIAMSFGSSDVRLANKVVNMETTVSSRILPSELLP